MKTLYDVLGVPWNASDEKIRAAFRKSAKLYHPDLNAGDPRAEQLLRHAIAAYEMLRNPQKRMAYDRYLRNNRRETLRAFAMTAVVSLVSGSLVVALVVTLLRTQEASGSPPGPRVVAAKVSEPAREQVAAADDGTGRHQTDRGRKSDRGTPAPNRHVPNERPGHLQQAASSVQPTAGHPAPRGLARESGQVQAGGDPAAIQAFAPRNPDTPESDVARSKLIALIDTAEDVSLLQVLRLGGTGVIAERAHQRLIRLGALAGAKEERAAARTPSANSLEQRAASFVAARVSAWSSASTIDSAALATAYADKVLYYGRPKTRQEVLLDKRRLLEQWPERAYAVQPGSIAVQCRANLCKVGGTMVWQTRSIPRATSASGIAQFEYDLTLSRGAFKILSESSPLVQRQGQEERLSQSPPTKKTAQQQSERR
jgi:curved DNA-binding protein CbpA